VQELAFAKERGVTVIDIRPSQDFQQVSMIFL
jgi:hypothetical protein